jgi:hypothetical protein
VDNVPLQLIGTPLTYDKMIKEQSDIGWNQIIKGGWSTEWVMHLDKTDSNQGKNCKQRHSTHMAISHCSLEGKMRQRTQQRRI